MLQIPSHYTASQSAKIGQLPETTWIEHHYI